MIEDTSDETLKTIEEVLARQDYPHRIRVVLRTAHEEIRSLKREVIELEKAVTMYRDELGLN